MKFANHHINLNLEIENSLLDELYQYGLSHYPNEYGGLLIGRYSSDRKTALVEQTILPKRYKATRYFFERGSDGLQERLDEYYKREPKLFYLGEWHTHPGGPIEPSERDKSTMKELVKHKDVYINNPIMLILAITKTDYKLGFYVQCQNRLHFYQQKNP